MKIKPNTTGGTKGGGAISKPLRQRNSQIAGADMFGATPIEAMYSR